MDSAFCKVNYEYLIKSAQYESSDYVVVEVLRLKSDITPTIGEMRHGDFQRIIPRLKGRIYFE